MRLLAQLLFLVVFGAFCFMFGTVYSSGMAWGVCHREFMAFLAAYDSERLTRVSD